MIQRLCALLIALAFVSCSKIEVDEAPLPSLDGLSPENIKTDLPVFSATFKPNEFHYLIAYPFNPIVIKGTLTYIDENGHNVFSHQKVSCEIKGRSSAYAPMKSLGMRFSSPLDNEGLEMLRPGHILAQHSLSRLDAVRFRNSGNDFGQTMLKDISYAELAIQADVDFELMYYKPCHMFVNNEYYGMLNLRTENNIYGMTGLNNLTASEISLMKIDVDNGNLEWDEGSMAMADVFEKALEQEDFTTLWRIVDESSFIDYLIFQDYIGNFDWPHNNARMYSAKGAPFRFILYDLDFAAFNNKNPILPEMEFKNDDLSKLYREMRKKPDFDSNLKARQKELYKKLTPDRFFHIVDKNTAIIEDEIPYLMAKYNKPENIFEWRRSLDLLRREFKMRDKSIRDKYDL